MNVENFYFWTTFDLLQKYNSLLLSLLHFYFGNFVKNVNNFFC